MFIPYTKPIARHETAAAPVDKWEEERVRDILRASGKLLDFDVADIPMDELREAFEIVNRSKRMRYASSISRESQCARTSGGGKSLIWDEVMK